MYPNCSFVLRSSKNLHETIEENNPPKADNLFKSPVIQDLNLNISIMYDTHESGLLAFCESVQLIFSP